MRTFSLGYYIKGDGAGMAALELMPSELSAHEKEEIEIAEGVSYGFGKPTADKIELTVINGQIHYCGYDKDKSRVWIAIQEDR